jgi:hypothetical protein
MYYSLQKQTENCGTTSHISCDLQHNGIKIKTERNIFINRNKLIKILSNW